MGKGWSSTFGRMRTGKRLPQLLPKARFATSALSGTERPRIFARGLRLHSEGSHHHSDFPRARLDVWVRRRLRAHPIRVALDAALAGGRDQHSDIDAAVLVPAPFFVDPRDGNLKAVALFACVGLFFPGTVALLNFESNRLMGPNIAGALSSIAPVFAIALAIRHPR